MKKFIALLLTVVLTATVAIGGTVAYLQDSDSDVNVMTLGNVSIDQTEDFQQYSDLYPGVSVTKKVTVTNDGSWPAYVRTVVAFEIGDMDESYLNISWGSASYTRIGVAEFNNSKYVLYVVYNAELAAGDSYTALKSVGLTTSADNAQSEAIDGNNNGTFEVLVVSQAVQTGGFTTADNALAAGFYAITTTSHPWVDATIDLPVLVSTAGELQEALNKGGTVILSNAITLDATTITVPAGVNATLDLNGKTISSTATKSNASMFHVVNTAKLTIEDSIGSGKITYHSDNTSYSGYTVWVEGELVLESGTLGKTGSWSVSYAVDVRPNAWNSAYTADTTFTMNGGNIVCDGSAIRVANDSSTAYSAKSTSFIMNGGKIDAAGDGVFIHQTNEVWDVLNVTVNGGTIEGDRDPIRIYGPAASSYRNGEDCIKIALSSDATLNYTGSETYTDWIVDGKIRFGGGATKDQILADTIITIDGVAQ